MLMNNVEVIGNVYLIHDKESRNRKFLKIKEFISEKFNKEIIEIIVDTSQYKKIKCEGHVTSVAYYRFSLADFLPVEVDKILYIDPDTIVTSKIGLLTSLQFDESTLLYAVDHKLNSAVRFKNVRPFLKKYFNTGVLFLDLKKWRSENVSKELWDFAYNKPSEFQFWDQDIMNAVFWNRWKELPYEFNGFMRKKKPNKLPIIIHYTSPQKPWKVRCYNSLKIYYWKYWLKTPFFGASSILIIAANLIVSTIANNTRSLRKRSFSR